jgi:hypothetical protein
MPAEHLRTVVLGERVRDLRLSMPLYWHKLRTIGAESCFVMEDWIQAHCSASTILRHYEIQKELAGEYLVAEDSSAVNYDTEYPLRSPLLRDLRQELQSKSVGSGARIDFDPAITKYLSDTSLGSWEGYQVEYLRRWEDECELLCQRKARHDIENEAAELINDHTVAAHVLRRAVGEGDVVSSFRCRGTDNPAIILPMGDEWCFVIACRLAKSRDSDRQESKWLVRGSYSIVAYIIRQKLSAALEMRSDDGAYSRAIRLQDLLPNRLQGVGTYDTASGLLWAITVWTEATSAITRDFSSALRTEMDQ